METAVQPTPTQQPNLEEAARFLEVFKGNQTFMTISEREGARGTSRVMQGDLGRNADILLAANAAGHGIFFTPNETDGKGRKAENVVRVRAVFVDLDGAELGPVEKFKLKPNIILESSPGKYHAYWLTDDVPLDWFTPIQEAISKNFSGDPVVKDLPRLMRVPGFLHQKAEPFMTRILEMNLDA